MKKRNISSIIFCLSLFFVLAPDLAKARPALAELPAVTITANDATATEAGPTTGQFTVTRTGRTNKALTVYLGVSGTAASGSDYNSIGTSVTIPVKSASAKITVTPVNDTVVESNETVVATLSSNAAYTVGTPNSATVTITSDDVTSLPTVTITASDATATEAGPTTGQFTITRSGSTTSSLTVYFGVSGTATSGSDYSSIGTSVSIPAGSASAAITVTPINDTLVESNETVVATVSSNAAYTVGSPGSGTVTITSDDVSSLPTVTITATDATATEAGPTTGQFTITRSGSTTSALTVYFGVSGTATSGSDYTSIGTSVSIPAGSASTIKTVTPINDTLVESNETVVVTLSSNAAYTVGTPNSATVTITSDDATDTTPPTPPANLTATAVSSSQINLSWSPSTDIGSSGLAGYKVYREPVTTTPIGTTTTTNYSDYNRAVNTQYCYRVEAYDNAGNSSTYARACATTQAPQSGSWVSFPANGFVDSTKTLYAVWTADASHVWVATSRSDSTAELLLWDGNTWSSRWSRHGAMIRGIWGSGPDDVWAVGLCGLILHWDGSEWTDEQNPAAKTTIGSFNAVWGSGPYDVWAVGAGDPITGNSIILRWNGSAWSSTMLSTATGIINVWGSGPGDVWAVGSGGYIMHWNGITWSTVRSNLSSQATLRGIWGSGPYDVWATGDKGNILHWDGIAWSIKVQPIIGQPGLFSVWGSSSTNVWAAGQSLSLRLWDGNSWTSVPTPATSQFFSIYGTDMNNAWAVGASGTLLRYQP